MNNNFWNKNSRNLKLKKLLDLPKGIKVNFAAEKKILLTICKVKMIEARRSGNDNLAAELSQVKEFIKHIAGFGHCKDCGITIGKTANKCTYHMQIDRRKQKVLTE